VGDEHCTSSDHEVIVWEVCEVSKPPVLDCFIGWDLSGWGVRGCSGEEGPGCGGVERSELRPPILPLNRDSRTVLDPVPWKPSSEKKSVCQKQRVWTLKITDLRKAVGRSRVTARHGHDATCPERCEVTAETSHQMSSS